MACGFIADTASTPLVVSNLVNIVSADFFGVGFGEYASRMVVPNIFAILSSLLVLYLVYRKDIPTSYTLDHIKAPESAIRDHKMFKMSWVILTVLLAGYFAARSEESSGGNAIG